MIISERNSYNGAVGKYEFTFFRSDYRNVVRGVVKQRRDLFCPCKRRTQQFRFVLDCCVVVPIMWDDDFRSLVGISIMTAGTSSLSLYCYN